MPSSELYTTEEAAARAVASPAAPPVARRRGRRTDLLADTVMVAPALILVTAFILIPIVIAVYLSMTNWDGFSPSPDFIGFKNYSRAFSDASVGYAAGVTAIVAVVGTLLCNVFGLGAALLVTKSTRINAFLRGVLFYPYIIGAVIIGFLWSALLGTNGAVNSVLTGLGLPTVPFLAQPGWALASVIFVIVWSGFGVNMVLYLAGLQTIPDSLIEAATIDGASRWQTFWKVKLPILAPVVTINIVLTMITLLRTYELVLSLTRGGPAGKTQTIAYYILNISFTQGKLGYGAAQAVLLMIVIVIVTVAITSFRRRAEQDVAA
jgi:raffinose/stachyose/melibiose transport system permease protein